MPAEGVEVDAAPPQLATKTAKTIRLKRTRLALLVPILFMANLPLLALEHNHLRFLWQLRPGDTK